jgi:hypothetical protein
MLISTPVLRMNTGTMSMLCSMLSCVSSYSKVGAVEQRHTLWLIQKRGVRKTGTPDRGVLVVYSNTGRIPIYLSYHIQVPRFPSTGKLYYWHSRRLRRFGLVAGAPSGRCGHARVV